MKLTPKQGHVVFAIIMVGTMTFIMTGVTSFVNSDFTVHMLKWMRNWMLAYKSIFSRRPYVHYPYDHFRRFTFCLYCIC
jgi:hypothetical protein